MVRYLHIISFDVPYPPDYGGVTDVFYKIKALKEADIKIILHCFEYGRSRQDVLEQYCEEVHYYRRRKTVPFRLPYIVSSRKNDELIERLQKDNHPILMEGVHCSYFLYGGELDASRCWVRLHNVEWEYYANLAKYAQSFFRRFYFKQEAGLLKNYEKELAKKGKFFSLSQYDYNIYTKINAEVVQIPLFAGKEKVTGEEGRGEYCLYHGNLSVPENEEAVTFLVTHVFSGLDVKLIVAGKNPSVELKNLCLKHNVECVPNPDAKEMDEFIRNAHINVLPAAIGTGIKVKIINSLAEGRFVVTNPVGTDSGSGWTSLCRIADGAEEWKSAIRDLWDQSFSKEEIIKRQEVFSKVFSDRKNADQIIRQIFK